MEMSIITHNNPVRIVILPGNKIVHDNQPILAEYIYRKGRAEGGREGGRKDDKFGVWATRY